MGRRGNALDSLDTLPTPRPIRPLVLLARRVIRHHGALDEHRVRRVLVRRLAARPVNRALGHALITSRPYTQPHRARRLREIVPSIRLRVLQCAHHLPVDHPIQPLLGPVQGVIVELLAYVRGDGVVRGAVEGRGVTFAEIIRHGMRAVPTHELPINLIQVIRLQHDGRDDAGALAGLHDHRHGTEEDVEFGDDGRGLAFLVDGEFRAVRAVLEVASCQVEGVVDDTGRIKHEVMRHSQGWVVGTCFVHGVAVCEGLRRDGDEKESQRSEEQLDTSLHCVGYKRTSRWISIIRGFPSPLIVFKECKCI